MKQTSWYLSRYHQEIKNCRGNSDKCFTFFEAATRGEKGALIEISQNSQENTCAGVSFLIKQIY